MNPCDTAYAVPIDEAIHAPAPETCEMCGALLDAEQIEATDTGRRLRQREAFMRVAEHIMWCNANNKGVGSMVRVIAAKMLNPDASIAQIAAAVGMTKDGAYAAMKRAEAIMPDVARAVWRTSNGCRQSHCETPRQGTPQAVGATGVSALRQF